MNKNLYQDIIKYAHKLTEEYYAFHYGTLYLKGAVVANIDINDQDTYKQLDSWLKGIRQDYTKILVAMNAIEKTQKQRIEESFEHTYQALGDLQETNELSFWIDYIFTRYRSILDYIYQVVLLCVPPQLGEQERIEYDKLSKSHKRIKFLLNYIASKIDSPHSDLLDIKVFKQIVDDRDYLVHDCASCLVFSDCREPDMPLTFKVWTKDSLEEDETEITDQFYCLENNLIDYRKYWGLQLSILIVFFDTIFTYLKDLCTINPVNLLIIDNYKILKSEIEDASSLPHIQDVFRKILGELIT